jgi:hypothetical protein
MKTKKNEMNTNLINTEPDLKKIEQFFKKNRMSGLIYVENVGILTLFAKERDKLLLLDSMRTELQTYEKERDAICEQRVYKKIKELNPQNSPSYTQ